MKKRWGSSRVRTKVLRSGVIVGSKSLREFVENLEKVEDAFAPRLSHISRVTGTPITTVYDKWTRLMREADIEIIVSISEKKDKKKKLLEMPTTP
jgi:hypothetical protein